MGLPASFTLSDSPTSISVVQGGTATDTVSLAGQNGFAGTVTVAVTGLPPGVTVAGSGLSLSAGANGPITISASSSATVGSYTATLLGTSGSLSSSALLHIAVVGSSSGGGGSPSATRTHYVRTDATSDPQDSLVPGSTVYDPVRKRFYVSDSGLGRITVFDAATQAIKGSIAVPGALGMDETPDGTVLYAATAVGDVYAVDPGTLLVTHRYLFSLIGPQGYGASAIRVLANGKLALLGGQGPLQNVDGASSVAVWDPVMNSLQLFETPYSGGSGASPFSNLTIVCGALENIGGFTLTGDRTHIVIGSIDSDFTLCVIDPLTGLFTAVTANGSSSVIAASPDGNTLVVPAPPNSVAVYDAHTLTERNSFAVAGSVTQFGDISDVTHLLISPDSQTLYISDGSFLYSYNIAAGVELG